MKTRIAILGSGDLGQLLAWHISSTEDRTVVGYFDDFATAGTSVDAIPILGGVSEVLPAYRERKFDELLVGVGYKHPAFRQAVWERFNAVIPFATFIHLSASVDRSCQIGAGSVILPGCTLDRNVQLGHNVLLNTACVIAHDSSVADHSFIGPGVIAAGFVHVAESCFLGTGTIVIDNISICAGTQTGGGTVVTQNIEKPGLYVGNPARFVR